MSDPQPQRGMSDARAYVWVVVLAVFAAVYIVTTVITRQWGHNLAWVLLMVAFAAAGVDLLRCALRGDK